MKTFLQWRDRSSKGAALMIILAFVVLLTGLALAYFSRASTDRQLAQSSYNDTSADLLARSALDIVVNDFKQEILNHPTVTPNPPNCFITPVPYTPAPLVSGSPVSNLMRQSFYGDPTGRTSSVNSTVASANGRSISTTRWNSHYLIPRGSTSDTTVDPSPTPSFTAPDWVLVTAQGPARTPPPSAVIGRYAFAVYDEGSLLDMSIAGYPNWPDGSCSTTPTPTPWLVNVGRKGTVGFADLTALPWPGLGPSAQSRIDNIVGWRNFASTQRTASSFGNFTFTADCAKQDHYGSYLLDFGDPPFSIESLLDKLTASTYPFSAVGSDVSNSRTDQAFITRQELLKLVLSLGSSQTGYNQNVLQYMGTFSRERNRPAPDWPNLQGTGSLSEGRFNLNNLDLVKPNPGFCNLPGHGRHRGWFQGNGRGHRCGTPDDVIELFGLLWVPCSTMPPDPSGRPQPGHWRYIEHNGRDWNHDPNSHGRGNIPCLRGPNHQNDFFQILDYAMFTVACSGGVDADPQHVRKTMAIGASLIDQYDDDVDDLDTGVAYACNLQPRYQTHTTVIEWGVGQGQFAYGMENSDIDWPSNANRPHRPVGAPTPTANPTPQVIGHAFTNVGELGYGIDTWTAGLPALKFWDSSTTPPFQYAPVLDFFSYNPVSSAYPRAGIVNLYTKNAPVIAAVLKSALKNDTTTSPPASVVSQTEATNAANAIVAEAQRVLVGNPTSGSVQQTDLTRAIVGRLAKAAFDAVPTLATSNETKGAVVRALAEVGQTRTWNLFIDVIAQTGRYAPDATNVTQANKFIVEGEKRYWLHIALGRDLVYTDGTPCLPGDSGCQVDVLGTQLEEVIE